MKITVEIEKAPCASCRERNANCHSVCDKYREWRIKFKETKERVKAEEKKEYQVEGALVAGKLRTRGRTQPKAFLKEEKIRGYI